MFLKKTNIMLLIDLERKNLTIFYFFKIYSITIE